MPHPQVSTNYTSVSWITLLTLCFLVAGTNPYLLLLQHLLSGSFTPPTPVLGCFPSTISCHLGTMGLNAWFSNLSAAPLPRHQRLSYFSPLPLFSRLKESGEALGRKKTNFFWRLIPSLGSFLGVGASCASMGLLIILWLLILPVCTKDLAVGHSGTRWASVFSRWSFPKAFLGSFYPVLCPYCWHMGLPSIFSLGHVTDQIDGIQWDL